MTADVLSPEAQQDLQIIWDFIAADNVGAADKLLDEFFETFEQLAEWLVKVTRVLISLTVMCFSGLWVLIWSYIVIVSR